MRMFKGKKGFQIGDIPMLAIVFGVGVIVLSIVSSIVTDVQTTQSLDSAGYNVSTHGLEGLSKIAEWLPTIGLIIGAVIIISALGALFTMRMNR